MNYYWQSGSLTFTNIILAKQLNFIHHLANLPQDELARTIFDESVNLKLPGLYQQCERYLNEMGIMDLQVITKGQMKSKVKKFIRNKTRSELLVKSQNYKKLDFHKLSRESLERKPYFARLSLEDARMFFRVTSKLVPNIRNNFPSKYRRQGKPLTCPACTQSSSSGDSNPVTSDNVLLPLHTQSHILTDCVAVSDLRAECDENDDHSLAVFFKKVVARHNEMEEA